MNDSAMETDTSWSLTGNKTLGLLALIVYIMLSIGAIGNIFAFLVFCRSAFSHLSLSVFLRILAILDFSVLLVYCIAGTYAGINTGKRVHQTSNYARQKYIAQWIIGSLTTASAWMIVAITSERFTAVYSPFYVKIIFTKKRALFGALRIG